MSAAKLIVIGLISLLGLSVIFILWPRSLKIALGLLRNMVLGLGTLWAVGLIFGAAGRVGINAFTAAVCAVLGIPGCLLLLLLKGFVL